MVIAARIGLAMRGDSAVAVRVARGRVLAEHAIERGADQAWSEVLARLLTAVRPRGWRAPRVGVCLADRRCRTVELYGESLESSQAAVAATFRAQPHAYAILGTEGVVAGSVWKGEAGWEGALLSKPISEALGDACRAAGVDLVAVAPSTAPDERPLAELAAEASALRSDDAVVVDPAKDARTRRDRLRRRTAMGAVAAAAMLWAALAPSIGTLRGMRALEQQAAAAEHLLASAGARGAAEARVLALRALAAEIARDRGRASVLLAGIARALPDSSAIAALRVEDTGGTVTLLAPRVADAVKRLALVPELREAKVLGSIVQEDHGGLVLQRVTLTWSADRGKR